AVVEKVVSLSGEDAGVVEPEKGGEEFVVEVAEEVGEVEEVEVPGVRLVVEEEEPEDGVEVVEEELKEEEGEGELKPEFTFEQVEELREWERREVVLRGVAVSVGQSQSGKTWYLNFGEERELAGVQFVRSQFAGEADWEEWEGLVGQELKVSGVARVRKGWGSRGEQVVVELARPEDIFVVEPPRVYEMSDGWELVELVGSGDGVRFEGSYVRFRKNEEEGAVYLFFEGGFEVAGRFAANAEFATASFAEQLKELVGKRVRLVGPVRRGPNEKVRVVIELESAEGLQEVE
ncbi:MAG: hypothetical protein AAGC74_09385, partial [Verrucomicrobiota bacterium]